jgi:hypothetical protein
MSNHAVAAYVFIAALAAAAAFFVSRNLAGALAKLGHVTAADLALLAPAGALLVAGAVIYGGVWAALVRRLGGAHSWHSCLMAFSRCWLSRYVPGTLPYHAARVLAAERLGATKRVALASIAYETILQVSSASLVAVLFILGAIGEELGNWTLYSAGALPLLTLPLLLRPQVLEPMANWALQRAGRLPIDRELFLPARDSLRLFAIYTAGHILNGAAFYLVCAAFAGPDAVSLPLAIGVWSMSGVLGIMTIAFPSGLGVREAAIVGLLGLSVPPDVALIVAGAARAVSVLADVAFVVLFSLVGLIVVAARRADARASTIEEPERELVA